MVVVLSEGDLSATEVENELSKNAKAQEENPPEPGTRIMFKKPTKRTSADTCESDKNSASKMKKSKKEKKEQKPKLTLLSFEEDDEAE